MSEMTVANTIETANTIQTQTDKPPRKETAFDRYRKKNLDKYNQYSINYYYRQKAKLPEELRNRKVGRPKKIKPPKEPKPRGRPRKKKVEEPVCNEASRANAD